VPVNGVGKFIAVGLNFADHAAESNLPSPARAGAVHQGRQLPDGPNDR
jgi:2,4-diketo-3-deoxy-L-fuconate hydrolase